MTAATHRTNQAPASRGTTEFDGDTRRRLRALNGWSGVLTLLYRMCSCSACRTHTVTPTLYSSQRELRRLLGGPHLVATANLRPASPSFEAGQIAGASRACGVDDNDGGATYPDEDWAVQAHVLHLPPAGRQRRHGGVWAGGKEARRQGGRTLSAHPAHPEHTKRTQRTPSAHQAHTKRTCTHAGERSQRTCTHAGEWGVGGRWREAACPATSRWAPPLHPAQPPRLPTLAVASGRRASPRPHTATRGAASNEHAPRVGLKV